MENLMALAGHAGALALSVSLSAALVRLCLHGAFSLLPTANQATRRGLRVAPRVVARPAAIGWCRPTTRFVVPEAAKGLPRACKAGLNR